MPYIGETAALITALLWSLTSIAFTEASLRVGSIVVNITRMIIAAIFLIITILLFQLDIQLSYVQILFLSLSGVIGLVIGDGFLFQAFNDIGARLSMLIMALVPPISASLAFIFLGEIISFWGIVGILITIIGITVVVLQKEENPRFNKLNKSRGLIFAFIGAVGQASGLILAKYAFNDGEINGFVATFVRIIPAIIVFTPLLYFSRRFKNPVKTFVKDKKAFKYTVVGSFVGPFLGITFSLIAISYTYVGIASTLMATVPIVMLPIVVFYYKEKLSIISIVGASIAVSGIAVLFLK